MNAFFYGFRFVQWCHNMLQKRCHIKSAHIRFQLQWRYLFRVQNHGILVNSKGPEDEIRVELQRIQILSI